MTRSILAAILVLTASGPVAAQDATPSPRDGCFRGRPLGQCRSFWITEAGYGLRLSAPDRLTAYTPGGWLLPTLELGGMKNVSDRVAVGATLGAGLLEDVYLTLKPRVRYWVSSTMALDLSPGLLLKGPTGMFPVTADASLMYRDRIGITAQSVIVPTTTFSPQDYVPTTRNRVRVYLGLRLGSRFGVGGAAADAAALLAAIGAYAIACGHSGCD